MRLFKNCSNWVIYKGDFVKTPSLNVYTFSFFHWAARNLFAFSLLLGSTLRSFTTHNFKIPKTLTLIHHLRSILLKSIPTIGKIVNNNQSTPYGTTSRAPQPRLRDAPPLTRQLGVWVERTLRLRERRRWCLDQREPLPYRAPARRRWLRLDACTVFVSLQSTAKMVIPLPLFFTLCYFFSFIFS